MAARLRSVLCADTPAAWAKAGFVLGGPGAAGNEVVVGPLRISLTGASVPTSAAPRGVTGLTGWTWSGLPKGYGNVAGVPSADVEDTGAPAGKTPEHPNGVSGIDHIVLRTGDLEAVKTSMKECGVDLRRERSDVYPGITQLFFRPAGEVIIEVVGPTPGEQLPEGNFLGELSKDSPPMLWGITFVSSDLDATKAFLGDNLSKVRNAVQKGRRIATLRTNELEIAPAIAIMSPHTGAAKL